MAWVLIILLSGNSHSAHSVPFQTQQLCQAAAQRLQVRHHEDLGTYRGRISVVCVRARHD